MLEKKDRETEHKMRRRAAKILSEVLRQFTFYYEIKKNFETKSIGKLMR